MILFGDVVEVTDPKSFWFGCQGLALDVVDGCIMVHLELEVKGYPTSKQFLISETHLSKIVLDSQEDT